MELNNYIEQSPYLEKSNRGNYSSPPKTLKINTILSQCKQKGDLAYEYHPFHNYLVNENVALTSEGFLIPEGKAINKYNGHILLPYKNSLWKDKNTGEIFNENDINILSYNLAKENLNDVLLIDSGSLIDLNTFQLNFDLEHPVNIETLPSYDGSVNLILNDGKNIPRLINSRFSVREKNTYEIVDRIGENDTNIYSSNSFDKDTSLYFLYKINPVINYDGLIEGSLPVGLYCFYLTYCDADGNESDFVAESGVIPVFIGRDNDPFSIDGGIKNLNSNKGVKLGVSNLDSSYNYLKVYYLRYFADYQQNRVSELKGILLKFPVNSKFQYIQITGNEEVEDLDPNILNISKFNPNNIKTLAQCKNMLFFGNVVKNIDDYRELQDCALRIVPTCSTIDIEQVNLDYQNSNNNFGYYNSNNMYNNVGYFGGEYYRFGVVFIYLNGSLSNVYNTAGLDLSSNIFYNSLYPLFSEQNGILKRNYIKIDDYNWIVNLGEYSNFESSKLNSKGVCKFPDVYNLSYNIKFKISETVKNFLKEELGIRGLFFVRLKRIPTLLGLCYTMPIDSVLHSPILYSNGNYAVESFVSLGEKSIVQKKITIWNTITSGQEIDIDSEKKELTDNYKWRLIEYNRSKEYKWQGGTTLENGEYTPGKFVNNPENANTYSQSVDKGAFGGICPDFLMNLPYYNQIFNGSKFKLKRITNNRNGLNITSTERHYQVPENYITTGETVSGVTINTVTEDVKTVAIKNKKFQLEHGKAEEAYRYSFVGEEISGNANSQDNVYGATNIVRGIYSPYLAIFDESNRLKPGEIYNIYLDIFENNDLQYVNRMNSSEPFYAISERYNWENLSNLELTCYRGDCFNNVFTYRLNRNFNDPSLPNNDQIIDYKTWKDHYVSNSEEWKNISRSDVNAVKLGSWITMRTFSSCNYALRSEDASYVSEAALMGSPRSFYPRKYHMESGNYKMPDSYLYNDAYRATLGYKCYFTIQDVNYIKNSFLNRIQYSAIAILDSYKNNFRDSLSTYFKDYSQEYGGITKLVGFEGYLLVILEHAIGIAMVNERVLVGGGENDPVYINAKNVLPDELTIISDTYGSQWAESIVKSEAGYVYGFDTVAKKIWRVSGNLIEILSDFRVNKFLVDNTLLKEKELTPIIGLRNVKTHYNNNKKDIIFTFYNKINGDEEKVWSLCFNELFGAFTTFYSWIPSFSENIDTQFFSFDRNTAKWLAYLNKCNSDIVGNTGVLVKSYLEQTITSNLYTYELKYVSNIEYKSIEFYFEQDHWGNYKLIKDSQGNSILKTASTFYFDGSYFNNSYPIRFLVVTPVIDGVIMPSETIAISNRSITNTLTTDFYLHGNSGIIDIKQDLYPCRWYDELHPFEFEFIVNDKIGQEKIFSNLVIISNKAEPESFHFEIEGDNFEFSSDKRAMYFRQENTKKLYQNLGSDILYNKKFTDVRATLNTEELYYREKSLNYTNLYSKKDKVYPILSLGLVLQVKSTIFPLYYEKIDTYNEIYHSYREMLGEGYDFKNLSGSEISWNRDLNLFNIVTHIKNSPIEHYGRLRGNSLYTEGKWKVLIPSIIYNLKNESAWPISYDYNYLVPPIVINTSELPKDITTEIISADKLPNIYSKIDNIYSAVSVGKWTSRKETKIQDKWMKVRIRYSGKNLAVIHSVITLYNIV